MCQCEVCEDPNITGGLPGHHINESIHCVLTHEMRPNEKCFSLNHGATRGMTFVIPIQAFSWMLIGLQEDKSFFFLWFFSIFKCADYLCRSYFQIRSVVKLMNWAWSCLLHKLLVFPHSLAHSPPLLCNQQISITHVPPACADCIRAPWMHSVQFVHKSAGLNLSLGAGL